MKKLIVMLAAVGLAAAASATTFSWGIQSGGALDSTKFANATAYLFYVAPSSTLSLPTMTDKASYVQADVTSSGATLYGTGALDADGKFYYTEPSNVPNIGGTTGAFKFYMAVISDDGKYAAVVTSTKTARIVAATTAGAAAWANTAFKTYGNVPEPTSALLLVMGGALLGLRRKRA